MKHVWVLVADEAIARILEKPLEGRLVPVEELVDRDAHAREAEFRHGPSGRRGGASTVSAGDSERHQHAQVFAEHIADRLEACHRDGRFDQLHIAAAPRMLGYLRPSLTPIVATAVARTLDKDLVHESPDELTRHLFAQAA